MAGKHKCLFCDLSFEQVRSWQKFCNTKCADKYRYHFNEKRKEQLKYEKVKEKLLMNRKKNPNTKYTNWKSKLKSNFNLTPSEYSYLFEHQDGQCAICKKELLYIDKNTHVDHCHASGKVRGLLCSSCNLGLGHFKDNPSFLSNAILYLGE